MYAVCEDFILPVLFVERGFSRTRKIKLEKGSDYD